MGSRARSSFGIERIIPGQELSVEITGADDPQHFRFRSSGGGWYEQRQEQRKEQGNTHASFHFVSSLIRPACFPAARR